MNNRTGGGTRKPKKMSAGKKAALTVGLILCVFFVLFCAVYGVFSHYYNKMNIEDPDEDTGVYLDEKDLEIKEGEEETENSALEDIESLEEALKENEEEDYGLDFDDSNVFNFLLVGSDSRGSDRGRSDTMIIVSINKETKKITMTSLMRDTYLTVPGLTKGNRLNAAYSTGGIKRLFATIKLNYKIDLEKYVAIDFMGFIDVVDILGGVTVNVNKGEKEDMLKVMKEICQLKKVRYSDYSDFGTGNVHLNGLQALCYARIRHTGNGEYQRTERQREILSILFNKIKKKGLSATEIAALADKLLPYVTTNFSQGDILSLLSSAPSYLSDYELVSFRMPYKGTYRNMGVRGMSVIGINFEKNIKKWHDVVYNGASVEGLVD